MNILFLTVARIENIHEGGIYTDLLRKFIGEGHHVFTAYPQERKYKKPTSYTTSGNLHTLAFRSLNIQKTNLIEKGIAMLMLERLYRKNIDRYYKGIKFDLILYSTPPITFVNVIKYLKKKHSATSYLMLKDIFPQNAVDLGMMKAGGLIHGYFRRKEEKLYALSDHIGCMSPANADYICSHNSIAPGKVEVCPNSIEPATTFINETRRKGIRNKYGIPDEAVVCLYGGNLGKPQGLQFLLDIMAVNKNNASVFFVTAGSGTEYGTVVAWFDSNKPNNALLLPELCKSDYDQLLQACDIGMLFLDPRFTIPNFPSRLLSYLEYSLPVLMATDTATDIGRISQDAGFGMACVSGDLSTFNSNLRYLIGDADKRRAMGKKGRLFLEHNYTIHDTYKVIMKHCV